jgi:hypothetical protein
VADQQGSGAVAVVGDDQGEEREAKEALVDFAVHRLKGDLFPDLMDFMWGGGCPQATVIPMPTGAGGSSRQGRVRGEGRAQGGVVSVAGGIYSGRFTGWVWSVAARLARQVVRWLWKWD